MNLELALQPGQGADLAEIGTRTPRSVHPELARALQAASRQRAQC